MRPFLVFDEAAVLVDQIALIEPLSERDVDSRSGELHAGIPKDALTRITLLSGASVFVTEDFESVTKALQAVARAEGDES